MNAPTAFITGASSGIGAAFAHQLAARGYNLVLVARRRDRLETLAEQLASSFQVEAQALQADLSNEDHLAKVEACIQQIPGLEILVNNAGFGTVGRFARLDVERQIDMVQVHITATLRLSRAALPAMIARRKGGIINTASVAAFLPMPGSVTYSASKAFLVSFSEGLQGELRGTGVKVQALCPGFTYSEFHDTSEYNGFKRSQYPKFMWATVDEVVTASLKALNRGKVVVIPGLVNRLIVWLVTGPVSGSIIRWASMWVLRR